MQEKIKKRVLKEANMLVKNKMTIRELANTIGLSKSTIHNDMRKRLIHINKELYLEVNSLFIEHIKMIHYIGGLSTQKKYKKNTIK